MKSISEKDYAIPPHRSPIHTPRMPKHSIFHKEILCLSAPAPLSA